MKYDCWEKTKACQWYGDNLDEILEFTKTCEGYVHKINSDGGLRLGLNDGNQYLTIPYLGFIIKDIRCSLLFRAFEEKDFNEKYYKE
jgi:hypothetical protein